MIINLKLTYFRRHESLSIDFTSGLNALRGPNEGGKSTVIEAALYALYGAKALRDTLAETVTWGRKEKDLAVELVIRVRGVMYSFTRSKGGAECRSDDGVVVTGQAEVTNYAADLLGADAKTASLLMLASQSGLRGALDDGPAAVSGLMAKLADFDILDRILNAANERLQLGATQPIVAKIEAAEKTIADAEASRPGPETITALTNSVTEAQAQVTELTRLENETYQPAVTADHAALVQGEEHNKGVDRLETSLANNQREMANEDAKIKEALKEITANPGDAVIAALREDVKREADHANELKKYQAFQAIQYPADYWEGTVESFDADMVEARKLLADTEKRIADMEGQRRTLVSRRITNGKCPTCGHAANSDEHVAQHNAQVDVEIAALDKQLAGARPTLTVARAGVQAREAIQKAHTTMQRALTPISDRVKLDLNFVPHRAEWDGPVPAQQPSTEASRKLQEAERLQRAAQQAQGRHSAAVARVEALQAEERTLRLSIERNPRCNIETLRSIYDNAYAAYAANAAKLREAKQALQTSADALKALNDQAKRVDSDIASARARITEYQADIKKVEFNNDLVARLKKLKPAITDHLWNTVLAAVSTFFSQMRGETSVVTKDKDGFRVNDKSIDSLSGSTIDVLALAVRVALTKTFIPHASFVVLDEPAHGCDNDRTGNVLGFLASAGFEQTILASHDELSEAVADNVISLSN